MSNRDSYFSGVVNSTTPEYNSQIEELLFSEGFGVALYTSRRFIRVFSPFDNQYYLGTFSRHLEITPGDVVKFTYDNKSTESQIAIDEIVDRKNLLKRSYDKKTKLLAANLSQLWLVTAPPPLCNTTAIDRTLTSASVQNIQTRLIANKSDLENHKEFMTDLSLYSDLVTDINPTCAITKNGITELKSTISKHKINILTITGISGVGKSSLISAMYPDLDIKSGDVSLRTGQGKQTTSASIGYVVDSDLNAKSFTLLIDLPGIQNYGISHLSQSDIIENMPDILSHATNCKFRDCKHKKEPQCAVISAIESGELAKSRYLSFCDMISELESLKEY